MFLLCFCGAWRIAEADVIIFSHLAPRIVIYRPARFSDGTIEIFDIMDFAA